jgi:hypothetical protein
MGGISVDQTIRRPPRRSCRCYRTTTRKPRSWLRTTAVAERVSYDSPKGKINGYLVRGKALGKRPAVIVIHENR